MNNWICPNCTTKRVPYGTKGCDDPHECPETKNTNWVQVYSKLKKYSTAKGTGISEISNE